MADTNKQPSGELTFEEFAEAEGEEKVHANDISYVLAFLKPFAGPYKKSLWLLAGILLVETAFNFSFPLVMQHLIDDGLVERDWNVIVNVLWFLGFAACAITLLGIWSDYIYTSTFTSMVRDIRQRLFNFVQTMSMPFFHRTQSGAITSRFSGDIVATETALVTFIPYFVTPALEVIYSTFLMFYFDFWLGLIGCLIFPMVLWLPRIFAKRAFARAYEKRKMEGGVIASVQENVSAQPVIKAFGLAGRARRDFGRLNQAWRGVATKGNFSAAMVERASHSGLYFIHIAVFGLGVYWVYTERISLGTLIAFEGLFLSMGYALTDVTQYVPNLAQMVGSMRHMGDLLREKPSLVDMPGAGEAPAFKGDITFDKVGFWYEKAPADDDSDDDEEEVDNSFRMSDLNLTIPHGSFVGIAGASGSGKSTMLNLLLRFYDPTEGAVRFDGVDARDYTQQSLRSHMGVVFQENFLFNTTIGENIKLGFPDATMEDIRDAARLAEVDDFIMSLPAGYDTMVGERGGQLSGGQRQRVAIARALVRNPSILILDEATSALDAATEAKLNETLVRIAKTRTVVSVTHRLGSIEQADKIVLMADGAIAEMGSHKELLKKKNGLYAALWRQQRNAAKRPAGAEDDEE